MNYMASYYSDVGTTKGINQDSLCIKSAICKRGRILLAAVCDGMGGNDEGEVASKAAVEAVSDWFDKRLSVIVTTKNEKEAISNSVSELRSLIVQLNHTLCTYGNKNNIKLGTTLSLIIIYPSRRYVIGHVGDSRIYAIDGKITLLTRDQSLVAEEARRGIIPWNSVASDPRRNVLLECIGISEKVNPVVYIGKRRIRGGGIVLCSDGLYHELTEIEMRKTFSVKFRDKESLQRLLCKLVNLVKQRGEKDNITVVYIAAEND